MVDLTAEYVGLKLSSPLIVAPAGITETVERMQKCEDQGAGAVVVKTLFEYEVTRKAPAPRFKVIRRGVGGLKSFGLYSYEQASTMGPRDYARELARAKKALKIPVIASINCVTDGGWAEYARLVEHAGADALEVNVSCPHSSVTFSGGQVEQRIKDVVGMVRKAVSMPVIPKLSLQLTSPLGMAVELEKLGINGLVLFNRLTGLDIDLQKEEPVMHKGYAGYGGPWTVQFGLRWISAIAPTVKLDISASGGVTSGEDIAKYILAGAATVQVCTTVIMEGYAAISRLNKELVSLMRSRGYHRVEDFRGRIKGRILGADQVERYHAMSARIVQEECRACGLCKRICIYSAVDSKPARVPKGKVYFVTGACDGCGLCAELCPHKAITMETNNIYARKESR